MIKTLKKIIAIFAACLFCAGALTSCDAAVDRNIKKFVEEFFEAVEDGDYTEAETYLHPIRAADFNKYFSDIENNEGVDFQSGIKIERYISYSVIEYDRTLNGTVYELKVRTKVSGVIIRFAMSILKNGAGYGIYSLKVDG